MYTSAGLPQSLKKTINKSYFEKNTEYKASCKSKRVKLVTFVLASRKVQALYVLDHTCQI